MTLLLGCLVGWLVVLLVVRWAERGVREAATRAYWLADQQQALDKWASALEREPERLEARLRDADDPALMAEGLGMVPPEHRSPREHIVTFSSFSPADQAVLDEADKHFRGMA